MQDEDLPQDIITPGELQAELNSLRNLRRRSLSSPSEGALDPDLISSTASTSVSSQATGPISNLAYPLDQASTSAATEQLDGLPDDLSSDADTALPLSDLFWLPAHLHPEIAPQKFKQFLREQTKPENLQRRTSGKSGAGLDRKKSMLSRQYDPDSSAASSESDHDSGIGSTTGSMKKKRGGLEGLTISDLQRLESLAVQAAQETGQDEQGQLAMTNLLRRSLSLDQQGARDAESADSPLIVPAPGSILRRSARTKIRKPSLLGDGGGHRFAASRRNKMSVSPASGEEAPLPPTTPERETTEAFPDLSSPTSPSTSPTKAAARLSAGYHRPTSASFADSIIVPVSTPHTDPSISKPPPRHQRSKSGDSFLDTQQPSPSATSEFGILTSEPEEAQHQTYPGRRHTSPTRQSADLPAVHTRRHSEEQQRPMPSFTPLQQPAQTASEPNLPLSSPPPASVPASVPPSTSPPTSKEKEKKSTWARFGLSRTGSSTSVNTIEDSSTLPTPTEEEGPPEKRKGKKAKKSLGGESTDEVMPKREKEKEKDKDSSGFFGLFKKKPASDQDGSSGAITPPTSSLSPTASGMMGKNGKYTNFYRLPIHVERAVYRLSHIKLANPRRPLYEQVLISNLMFWYLSVINKPQHPPSQQHKAPIPPPHPVPVPTPEGSSTDEHGPNIHQISGDAVSAEDANDDQPLMKREPETAPVPSARLVSSDTGRPDRSASLISSPVSPPLINVKRTTTRNDGFEVMHRQPKESTSRRVVSESSATPSTTRSSKSRPKETESAWLSSAETSRPAPAMAPDTTHLDAPIDIPVHTRSSSTPSRSPPKSNSTLPPSVGEYPARAKSPSRPGMGSRKSSSAKFEPSTTKTAVHS